MGETPPSGRGGPDGGRVPATGGRPSLLALRALGLGDFATAVPALRALERALPSWRRTLAGPAWYRHLVALAGLDWEVLPTEPLCAPDTGAPDLAVNLHGRGPQSTAALAALTPVRLWTHGHPSAPRWPGPEWPEGLHDAEIWCRLLRSHGVAADPDDLRWPRPAEGKGAVVEGDTAIVHPGAASGSRRWPAERFARVAGELSASGLRVLVTGSQNETALAERVAEAAGLGGRSVLAGRTSLDLLARLVSQARLVVCGDTGVGHLATAYGTPSVRLFGPVSPELWGPRVDREVHACLWAGRPGDPHSATLDPGLDAIGVEEVVAACRTVCASGRPTAEDAVRGS
ncbi:glycosyltransferase family 9 protein [Nocardiopsis alborubida]|uniref:Glycosyltransferase family 9 protein n=1 Tax=Nocardiopsis alborubida TaxID=146802 RepID=A0A7X6MFU2_9ACTN|nr:glycosyltransferase family 9 protein [Nocardiopsis alborubida]NKY98760.1 glycosyltransferase family 9 protein [Nocardiopsis alborubida]